jgi:hypothetical protein
MAGTTDFVIGANVSCSDGLCGKVTRVVINPVAQTVTHLVIEPEHRQGLGRLVPLDLVTGEAEDLRLDCTIAEFQQLDSAEDTQFIPGSSGYAAYGPDQVVAWPYYGLGGGVGDPGGLGMGPAGSDIPGVSQTVTYDAVPPGEVSVRRGEHVHATDGDIGRSPAATTSPTCCSRKGTCGAARTWPSRSAW